MTAIHQFQVTHDQEQDRLLLKILTTEGHELRFWLTRRFTGLLLNVLGQVTSNDPAVANQPEGPARDTVADFRRESALAEGDFSQPFSGGAPSPQLGPEPLLLAQIKLERGAARQDQLNLQPLRGHGVTIGLTHAMTHSLVKLLGDASRSAEWALGAAPAPAPAAEGLPPGAHAH